MANTTLIFSDSGGYKTTNLGFAARWIYGRTKKKVRLVTAEQYRPIQPLIDIGIIDVVDLRTSANPLVSLRKLSYGWWMTETGKLGPAVSETWLMDNISCYLVEGLTSISDMLMEDARDKQRQIGQAPVGKFTEEDEKFCNNPLDHYGFVQREVLARVRSFATLPVEMVLFSSHEARGEESDSRAAIRGPGLAGTAATDKVGKEVGNLIHFEIYSELTEDTNQQTRKKTTRVIPSVKAFFVPHPDPKVPGVTYKCKVRLPSDRIPELMKRFPGGYFEPTLTGGLDRFLQAEDELLASTTDDLAKWKNEVDSKQTTAATT